MFCKLLSSKRRAGTRDAKEALLLQFCLQKNTNREPSPKGGKKKGSFIDPDFPPGQCKRSQKREKKKLVGSESLTRSPGVRVRRMHACPLAWTDGLHLLVDWPGTCLEMHYFFLKKKEDGEVADQSTYVGPQECILRKIKKRGRTN